MKLTLKDIESIIAQEIAWCENNRNTVSSEYWDGFVLGLCQAEFLLTAAEDKLQGETER